MARSGFASDSSQGEEEEEDVEEWGLSQENAFLLACLREQQAYHEENVKRMFKDQLRMISLKLASLQSGELGLTDEMCKEEPVHPPRSSWQPQLLVPSLLRSEGDHAPEDLTDPPPDGAAPKPDIYPDPPRVSFQDEVEVELEQVVKDPAKGHDVTLVPELARDSSVFHLDSKLSSPTRTEASDRTSGERTLQGMSPQMRSTRSSFFSSNFAGTKTKGWDKAERAIAPDFDFRSSGYEQFIISRQGLKSACLSRDVCLVARMIEKCRLFQFVIEVLIFANGVLLGVQQNWLAHNLGRDLGMHWTIVDAGFAVVFSFELVVRVASAGYSSRTTGSLRIGPGITVPYFIHPRNPEVWWNLFDTLLVVSANLEVCFKLMTAETIVDMSTGRILRMMRLVRIIRVVRVLRFFKDLRVMVLSILSSLRPLVFALCLLGMLIYVVSVFFMHFLTEELFQLKLQGDTEAFTRLDYYYGSLTSTTYTLFMSISGGVSWGEVAFPLWRISSVLGVAFCLYVSFSMFCVLNIITGIFVEEATTKTCQDEEHMIIREMEKRKKFIAEAKRFFKEADKDDSGQLDYPEFKERLENIRMQKLLENLGIDVWSMGPRNVFEMFDYDGNGCIDIIEFTAGLQRLRGGARSIEIAAVRSDQKKVLQMVKSLSDLCRELLWERMGTRDMPRPQPRLPATASRPSSRKSTVTPGSPKKSSLKRDSKAENAFVEASPQKPSPSLKGVFVPAIARVTDI